MIALLLIVMRGSEFLFPYYSYPSSITWTRLHYAFELYVMIMLSGSKIASAYLGKGRSLSMSDLKMMFLAFGT